MRRNGQGSALSLAIPSHTATQHKKVIDVLLKMLPGRFRVGDQTIKGKTCRAGVVVLPGAIKAYGNALTGSNGPVIAGIDNRHLFA